MKTGFTIGLAICLLAVVGHAQGDGWTNSIIIEMLGPFDAKQLLQFAAHNAGLEATFSPEMESSGDKSPALLCAFPAPGTEARHIASWALLALDAVGNVNGPTLRVAPRTSGTQAPLFDCRAEVGGKWREAIPDRLGAPFKADPALMGSYGILLGAIVQDARIPLIVEPKLAPYVNLPRGIIEKAQPRTCQNVLAAALAAAKWEAKLQGGVLFITEKKERMPNEAPEDTSLRAEPQR
jgi:hypothetical protein